MQSQISSGDRSTHERPSRRREFARERSQTFCEGHRNGETKRKGSSFLVDASNLLGNSTERSRRDSTRVRGDRSQVRRNPRRLPRPFAAGARVSHVIAHFAPDGRQRVSERDDMDRIWYCRAPSEITGGSDIGFAPSRHVRLPEYARLQTGKSTPPSRREVWREIECVSAPLDRRVSCHPVGCR
jgi:hypothetical protein